MGKWSPDYHDDILSFKIKGLVSGAIKRSELEKADPPISYEHFVQDLDTGDSFTTSVIDILVKELAERRTRPAPGDRRLIADGTSKSLRMLATPLRVYRERSSVRSIGRRTVNLTEYLTAPPDEMDMDEDDDEFESMLDGAATSTEGARVNAELYDAYGSHSWGHPSGSVRRAHPYPTAPGSEEASPLIPPVMHSPPTPNRNGPWSLPPGAATSLTSLSRQSSIRRPPRTRTGDFSDFTSRRRSSIRETLGSRSDPDAPTPELSPVRDSPWSRNSQSTRRFFPFSRTRRHESSVTSGFPWNDIGEGLSADGNDESGPYAPMEPSPSSAAWFSFPTPLTSATSSQHDAPDTETSDERAQAAAPRLRRGGVRAPESMLSRHASPVTILPDPTIIHVPTSPVSDADSSDNGGDPAATYPTPASTDNENVTQGS